MEIYYKIYIGLKVSVNFREHQVDGTYINGPAWYII